MAQHGSRQAGGGLERSCGRDWMRVAGPVDGIERMQAWFAGPAYARHRHDSYAVCVTEAGVQGFNYRGAGRISTAGEVVVLHPDEMHDGYAASADGFGYRIVYVEPARIAEAVRTLCGGPRPLPFVAEAVSRNRRLARAVRAAFDDDPEPLARDALVLALAEGLLDGAGEDAGAQRAFDVDGVDRARQYLDAVTGRVVRTAELEAVSGLSRYDLARQFRGLLGTSPYRYSLMRRLEHARRRVDRGRPLAEAALGAGFADQAHFTRHFKAAYGLTPARFRALRIAGQSAG